MRQRKQLLHNAALLASLLTALMLGSVYAAPVFANGSDNFDDNLKDPAKWGKDEVKGRGHLNETSGRLEYVCASGSSKDSSDRPWVLTQFPASADWEITIDATNTTSPGLSSGKYQFSSFGINVRSASNPANEIEVEIQAIGQSFGPPSRGVLSEFNSYGILFGVAQNFTGDTSAPIRLSFHSTAKIFTVSYYRTSGADPQWIVFGSFGVGPLGGGGDGNADWGLTGADRFVAYVFGYSENMAVKDGELYGDNFVETGGVPWTGPSAGPTGSFKFAFPRNNPLPISMASVMGNYRGVSPGKVNRNYNIDIAQDESGKLSAMGTVEGIADKQGNPELSGNVGAIKTVNGQPMIQLGGRFTGSTDGKSTTLSGTAALPAEVADVGGGTEGIAGTGSYSAKVGGVPFSGKNVPIQIAAPPGAVDNLKKDWTLQIDIVSKPDAKGKSQIMASSQLVLPNGDTILFPERKTNYSAKTGYSLAFSRGTNVTVSPPKLDMKTSISIKGMTLVEQNGFWQPTGGTIFYKFMGQKGSGNLLDLVAP